MCDENDWAVAYAESGQILKYVSGAFEQGHLRVCGFGKCACGISKCVNGDTGEILFEPIGPRSRRCWKRSTFRRDRR